MDVQEVVVCGRHYDQQGHQRVGVGVTRSASSHHDPCNTWSLGGRARRKTEANGLGAVLVGFLGPAGWRRCVTVVGVMAAGRLLLPSARLVPKSGGPLGTPYGRRL